jgi:hypothetical protein
MHLHVSGEAACRPIEHAYVSCTVKRLAVKVDLRGNSEGLFSELSQEANCPPASASELAGSEDVVAVALYAGRFLRPSDLWRQPRHGRVEARWFPGRTLRLSRLGRTSQRKISSAAREHRFVEVKSELRLHACTVCVHLSVGAVVF